jgi:hypothetical protein
LLELCNHFLTRIATSGNDLACSVQSQSAGVYVDSEGPNRMMFSLASTHGPKIELHEIQITWLVALLESMLHIRRDPAYLRIQKKLVELL